MVEYIDREKIRREEEIDAKRKAELTAEQRREKQLSRQVEGAWEEKRKEEQRTAGIEVRVYDHRGVDGPRYLVLLTLGRAETVSKR